MRFVFEKVRTQYEDWFGVRIRMGEREDNPGL